MPRSIPFEMILPCNSVRCMSFCNVEHWPLNLGLHHSMCQTLSPQRHSNTSLPLWVKIGKPFCEQLDYLTSPLGVELHEVNSTCRWEKFTRLCLCESPYYLRGRFFFRLTNPNTSSPSKCNILDVYEKPIANLVTITSICNGSPNWLALHNRNSSAPIPEISTMKESIVQCWLPKSLHIII